MKQMPDDTNSSRPFCSCTDPQSQQARGNRGGSRFDPGIQLIADERRGTWLIAGPWFGRLSLSVPGRISIVLWGFRWCLPGRFGQSEHGSGRWVKPPGRRDAKIRSAR